MELTKKTTILFPPELHERLTRKAEREETSLGELVRRACHREYGGPSQAERRRALDQLLGLELPVGEPDAMKRESVPSPDEISAAGGGARRADEKVRVR